MTSRWNNPTGGLRYHLDARARHRTLWAPFLTQIQGFLERWSPPEEILVLLGPSGGWCLPTAFLGRFSKLVAVDIDPFAPWVFRHRHRALLRTGHPTLVWDARDHLSPGPEGFSPRRLRALLDEHPGAAVLWCNLLGQLPLFDEAPPDAPDDAPPVGSFEHYLRALPEVFAGRSWATFHDRISGPRAPHALDGTQLVPWSSEETLLERHYAPIEDPSIELMDHRTGALCRDAPRWQFAWELAPGHVHLIEAMSFRAAR